MKIVKIKSWLQISELLLVALLKVSYHPSPSSLHYANANACYHKGFYSFNKNDLKIHKNLFLQDFNKTVPT